MEIVVSESCLLTTTRLPDEYEMVLLTNFLVCRVVDAHVEAVEFYHLV
jgi:hypothetical protein